MGVPTGGFLESAYKVLMRRNSVYVGFVLAGALVGEKVVSGGFDAAWERNNAGKLYSHLEPKWNALAAAAKEEE